MSPCCGLAVPLPRFQYQKQQTQQQQQKQQQQQHQQQHHQQQQLQQQQQTQQQKRPKHPKPQKAIKTTAANHEKTCEESNRCQKTFKKTKEISNKNDAPKKQKKLQKLTKNRARGTQNGARMHPKWSQNRKKCAESPKVATRWLPRPLYPEGAVDF